MSVSVTNVRPLQVETPRSLSSRRLSVERLASSATGDATTGTVTISFDLNPETSAGVRRFYAITDVQMASNDLSAAFDHIVYPVVGEFERSGDPGSALTMPLGQEVGLVTASFQTARPIKPSDPIYLGRLTKDAVGTLNFRWEVNTNLKTYNIEATILWSNEPFVIPQLVA